MIYLDNAATTKPSPSTIQLCQDSADKFYNPSALYYPALQIKSEIESTRKKISSVLNCNADEIYFTSGATESNNWVFSRAVKNKKGNIVISAGEHPSVYESALALKAGGTEIRIVSLTNDGIVNKDELLSAVDENTTLVSVMHVSNETGVVNPVNELAKTVKQKNNKLLFHSDGVQAFCKIPIDLNSKDIDLYSISAHKIGGLKGIGALYIKNGLNIPPLLTGGGQESRLRSGTENVLGILSFQTAISDFDGSKIRNMYEYTVSRLSKLPEITINGLSGSNSNYIISVGIQGIKSEILQHVLCDDGLLIGIGSACSSKSKKNRTLEAMKVKPQFIEGNIRISFSPQNTPDEIEQALNLIESNIEKFRRKING